MPGKLCQMKLNCVDAKVFPLPQNATCTPAASGQQEAAPQPEAVSQLAASNLMKYHLRPAARVDTVESVQQALSVADVQAELRTGPHKPFMSLLKGLSFAYSPVNAGFGMQLIDRASLYTLQHFYIA